MFEKELMNLVELHLTRVEFLIRMADLLQREMKLSSLIFLCSDSQHEYVFQTKPQFSMQYRNWIKYPKTGKERDAAIFIRHAEEIYFHKTSCYLKIHAGTQMLGILILPFMKELDYVYIATVLGSIMFLRRTNNALQERIKELTCMYQLNEVLQNDLPSDILFDKIVHLIPPAFQYPSVAGCRIIIGGETVQTPGFTPDIMQLRTIIQTQHESWGEIQVSYSADKISLEPIFFLEEEAKLLELIAQKLAQYLESKAARDAERNMVEQLRHADRLATLGTLTAGIAHEINEPLTNILGFAELAKKALHDPERVKADLEKIIKSSLHTREIVKKLLFFSRQMPVHIREVNLNTILEEGLYFLEYRCTRENIKVVKEFDSNLPFIDADSGQLIQVVVNLTVNSIQSMERGGELYLRTWYEAGWVYFSIRDTGHGMNKEIQKKIFLPFFTTKPTGQGTGLGLAVVHGILKSHHARIEVNSKPNIGTTFTIGFPERII